MKLLLLCFCVGFVHSADWSYVGEKGVENWPTNFPTCGGQRQSPINIPFKLEYESYPAFSMSGYSNMAAFGMKIKNNGHTAQIDIDPSHFGKTTVSGGGLNGTYIAAQLHFHWGRSDEEGSEHVFRDRKYPLELHVVHYKEAYGSLSKAVTHGDGLAVLGFFYVISDEDNTKLQPLIEKLSSVPFKDKQEAINIDFSDLMPDAKTKFYRYLGSLTTPGCNEVVVWTVFENKNTISSAQLAKFRQLYENKENENRYSIDWNYRPPQNLFDRKVMKNFAEDVPDTWHWGYEGEEAADYWPSYYQTCSGQEQSPINIPHWNQPNGLAPFDASLQLNSLEFGNYDKPITGNIKNNGHTIQVDIDNTDIYITKGGLGGKYIAAQFHFHWGHDNTEGSEHTLENKAYPLELHVVHYKEEYRSLGGALSKKDGLAVVGFFFKAGGEILNTNYDKIVSKLPGVKYKDSMTSINGFSLKDLTYDTIKLNSTTGLASPFYRYSGGLTTPPCLQIVTWTVMRNPIHITDAQIAAFREVSHIKSGTIGSSDKIKINFRPVQNLANRKVYQSENFMEIFTAGTSGVLPNILCMAAILISAIILK